MDRERKRLCSICARGGSKGVENKNIRLLLGIPLIAHSIRQAQESGLFAAVAVSSDSPKILDAARRYGADHLIERPLELASDTSAKVPAIRHCLEETERRSGETFGVLVDLDATSPLRLAEDIRQAVALLERTGASNVVTGNPAHRSPYFNLVELNVEGYVRRSKELPGGIVRRQDSPRCFDMNASIYVWNRDVFVSNPNVFYDDTLLYEMPLERSWDIDTPLDFEIVEFFMSRRTR